MPKRVAAAKMAAENKRLKGPIASAGSAAPSSSSDILAFALVETGSLAGSSMCTRSFAPMQPHEIREKIADLGLPSDYVVRLCDLCGGTSLHANVFPGHPDCANWEPLLPWASGSKQMPKNSICRLARVQNTTC